MFPFSSLQSTPYTLPNPQPSIHPNNRFPSWPPRPTIQNPPQTNHPASNPTGETTWCETATLTALRSGYRHLDCAWRYGVDGAVGAAIRRSEIPRAQIFVTTKFWPQFAAPANVGVCLDRVLDQMGLEYVDLYLVHWPVATVPGEELGEAVVDEGSGREALDLGCCPRDVAGRLGMCVSFSLESLDRRGWGGWGRPTSALRFPRCDPTHLFPARSR